MADPGFPLADPSTLSFIEPIGGQDQETKIRDLSTVTTAEGLRKKSLNEAAKEGHLH